MWRILWNLLFILQESNLNYFKIYICESKWFIVLFRLILESEFLNREPNTGWLTQVSNFWLLFQIKSMIIHFNCRHTYGQLSEKIVAEFIMLDV